jgi:hypothetical protein
MGGARAYPQTDEFIQQPGGTIILHAFFACVPAGRNHSLSVTSSQVTSCVISEQNYVSGKPDGKIQVGAPRCRWDDSIKMDLREAEKDGTDWIPQVQSPMAGCRAHGN